jgi:hypothetical protein
VRVSHNEGNALNCRCTEALRRCSTGSLFAEATAAFPGALRLPGLQELSAIAVAVAVAAVLAVAVVETLRARVPAFAGMTSKGDEQRQNGFQLSLE